MSEIIFTNILEVPEIYQPVPTSKLIPDWYKNTDSYVGKEKVPSGDGGTSGTIKRCMPVFDVMNSGYYLITHTDIWVSQKADDPNNPEVKTPWYEWPSFGVIQFHPVNQSPLHPAVTASPTPKWINPWGIKTSKGYSTLFIAPVHRNNVFVALPGVVDTDTYDAPVNIIFTLSDPNFSGLVPAGTPIAQVIPFKREAWTMKIGKEEDKSSIFKTSTLLKTKFFDSYKSQFRQVKEYK
jgi:hypothetical protein